MKQKIQQLALSLVRLIINTQMKVLRYLQINLKYLIWLARESETHKNTCACDI